MPKVYFRTSDAKAITKEITDEVNYNQVIEEISKKFKLQKDSIKLVYNSETQTKNFHLDPELPHHIVHIQNKTSSDKEEINVTVTVSNGKIARNVHNITTKANTKVKDFINGLYEEDKISKNKTEVESTELYHCGVKMNDDETFLDHGVENNANLNILLRDDYLDPADVQTCTTTLANQVNPLIMGLQMLPKYYTLQTQISQLSSANFFLHFQQRYEGSRINYLYSDFQAYRFPTSPQAEPKEEEQEDN